MNIGFDASRAFVNKRTGTENYSFQLLKNLLQIDQTNNYYIYTRDQSDISSIINPSTTASSKLPNLIIKKINYPRLWTQAGLALQTFKDPLDVLFVPSHTLPLIRRPGLKTVLTVHDLGAEYLPSFHQLKQRLYLNFMTHHQLKSATHLIAVSKATKNDLINKIGVPKEKITVVYEGFNSELFKPLNEDKIAKKLQLLKLKPKHYFLFVGTIQPRKNLERLIKAYAISSKKVSHPPQLVLAGGRGWLSDEIYDLPQKLGIKEQVKFLGYVADQDLPALYSGSLGFLFPSLFEGFGLPVLEAMACGTPVLTSANSSLPEVAGNAAILVNPESEEEISKGIDQLLNNSHLKKRLIEQGFKQTKNFSWEQAASETLKVIESI